MVMVLIIDMNFVIMKFSPKIDTFGRLWLTEQCLKKMGERNRRRRRRIPDLG